MKKRCFDGISVQNQRARNMDSLLLMERDIGGRDVCMAVVCDGVGSLKNGAVASTMAVRLLGSWFEGIQDTSRLGLKLRDQVVTVNRTVYRTAQEQGFQTAATLSALLLNGNQYYIVHLGDSRIYACREGRLLQLTQDQISETGKLDGCLGHTEEVIPYYSEGAVGRQRFLLCSDGLYKRAELEFLQKSVEMATGRNLKRVMERLVNHVIDRGERDNITIAFVLND